MFCLENKNLVVLNKDKTRDMSVII